MILPLKRESFRSKVLECMDRYLALGDRYQLTVGIYKEGKCYVWGNHETPLSLQYDIGSITKTVTAHLILRLADMGMLDLDKTVDTYIDLPCGQYPTLYELLTHTAGYGNLTPIEITLPPLLLHGYARKNIYTGCTAKSVIDSLARRKRRRARRYGYSDFAYAVLAVVAEAVTRSRFCDLLEDFVQNRLEMKNTVIEADGEKREPKAVQKKRVLGLWKWERNNPYLAGGGLVSNVADMLRYMSIQIESRESYITNAHRLCTESLSDKRNLATCFGWHTYKKSNQLWHVGGVGTFRSSLILNKKSRIGVVVLGNAKGGSSANVHYLAKMLYSELKFKRIVLENDETNEN